MDRQVLTSEQIRDGLSTLDSAWTATSNHLSRTLILESFLAAVDFIVQLAPIAEELGHHPDVALSWRTIRLSLTTHSSGGISALDFELARRLDELATP